MTVKIRQSAIRDELERLARANHGKLRPEAVVEAARSDTSPLHCSFTWDDTKAAQQYRLWQARQLINAVVVYEPAKDGSHIARPVFVSLTTDRGAAGAGYRLLAEVLSDDEHRQRLLIDACGEMQAFRLKYRRLQALARVFEAMADVEAAIEHEASLPMEATA